MADIYPPDFTSPLGQVRALIPDTVQNSDPSVPGSTPEYLFTDDELNALVSLHENVWLAAGFAVYALASNEALVTKKIRTEDLTTDGPAVANALYQHATALKTEGLRRLQLALDLTDGVQIIDYQNQITPEDRFEWLSLGPGLGTLPGVLYQGVWP